MNRIAGSTTSANALALSQENLRFLSCHGQINRKALPPVQINFSRNSPHELGGGPAQPDRENPAEREQQLAREGVTSLLDGGVLVRAPRRNLATAHLPGPSRPGAAVEKRQLSQYRPRPD